MMPNKLLGEILQERGKVTTEQIEEALSRQRETSQLIGHILFDLGVVTERDLQEAWGTQLGREFVDLRQTVLSGELLGRLDGELARRHRALPIREERGVVVVAMANPLDVRALGEIANALGSPVRSVIASADELDAAVERHYT
jgi:type IV pilus assembly protein PilB